MASESMEDKLWTLANAVTGFAILQSIAFLYAVKGDGFKQMQIASLFAKFGTAFAGILCGAIYGLAGPAHTKSEHRPDGTPRPTGKSKILDCTLAMFRFFYGQYSLMISKAIT
jgi:hypothetical protein